MLFKTVVALAVTADLLAAGGQDPIPSCIPNSSMVGTWHYVSTDGDAGELTLTADGSWHEWFRAEGNESSSRYGRCAVRDGGQLLMVFGVVARHEDNPRSIILKRHAKETRYFPGPLPAVPVDPDLFGTWHLTRWKHDSQALLTELTLSADGSFRRLESSNLDEPELTEGTFHIRPQREIEFVETKAGSVAYVEQFHFRVRGRSLTLESEDERQWFARGNERGFPAQPPPCAPVDPDTILARLGSLRPFQLSTYSQPTDIDAWEQNALLHRAVRAYRGSEAPLALKAADFGDEGQLYERYLIVRAGRAEYLYTSSGSWASGETASCAITAMRLADRDGKFVEPSSDRQAPMVRLLFRTAIQAGFP